MSQKNKDFLKNEIQKLEQICNQYDGAMNQSILIKNTAKLLNMLILTVKKC